MRIFGQHSWLSVEHPQAWEPTPNGSLPPFMLHFALESA
jgi:hypothetical protein